MHDGVGAAEAEAEVEPDKVAVADALAVAVPLSERDTVAAADAVAVAVSRGESDSVAVTEAVAGELDAVAVTEVVAAADLLAERLTTRLVGLACRRRRLAPLLKLAWEAGAAGRLATGAADRLAVRVLATNNALLLNRASHADRL